MDSLFTIGCPSCSRQLKLPEAARGKNVKCPVCQAIFKINPEDIPETTPLAITPKLPASLPPAKIESDSRRDDEEEYDRPPASRRSVDDDDDRPSRRDRDWDDRPSRRRDYDDGDDWAPRRRRSRYDYDDDDDFDDGRSYRRRRRREEEAASTVAAPAICLIVLGFLEIAASLFVLFFAVAMPAHNGPDREGKVIFLVFSLLGVLWAGLMLVGAFMMKSMRSYGMAMMASIMALVPCTIFNLGLGIWAIVVLNDSNVKKAFARNAE